MVSTKENLIFVVFQIIISSFKDLNNSQKLLIIDFIADFIKDYYLKEKSYQILLTNFKLKRNKIQIFVRHVNKKIGIQSYLTKDSIINILYSIVFNMDMVFLIKIPKNQSSNKSFFYVNKGLFSSKKQKIRSGSFSYYSTA